MVRCLQGFSMFFFNKTSTTYPWKYQLDIFKIKLFKLILSFRSLQYRTMNMCPKLYNAAKLPHKKDIFETIIELNWFNLCDNITVT